MTWDWADLLEAWCEEFSPETFYEQTARTFIAATKGRAKARERNSERDLILAYNTGAFSRSSKVKPLSFYLRQIRRKDQSLSAKALHYFGSLRAKGIPISITRVPRAPATE